MQGSATETVKTAHRYTKRIGSTTYEVSVYFSDASRESMGDKVLRLIESEVGSGKGISQ